MDDMVKEVDMASLTEAINCISVKCKPLSESFEAPQREANASLDSSSLPPEDRTATGSFIPSSSDE